MGRILIFSNNEKLSTQLRRDIEDMGHSAIATEFDDAAETIYTREPNLILVDLTLHGGIVEVWQQLRYDIENSHTPAIILITRDRIREIELLKGLNDFILYPHDVRELEMRIKLIMSKHESADAGDVIQIGNLVIEPAKYEVTVDGWPVILTLKEYELLKYLATHRGRVFTREILLDQIWGYDYYGGTRTVDVHIGRLRTKIETGEYSFIRTVRGAGYMFTDEYSTPGASAS
jgi:two-component system alkaline phosphatase synthesis response regulator PhoP